MSKIEINSSDINPIEFVEEDIVSIWEIIENSIELPDWIKDIKSEGCSINKKSPWSISKRVPWYRVIEYKWMQINVDSIWKDIDKSSYWKKYCLHNWDIYYLSTGVKTQIYKNDWEVILYEKWIIGNIFEITVNDKWDILLSSNTWLYTLKDWEVKMEESISWYDNNPNHYLNSLTLDDDWNIYYLIEINWVYNISINWTLIKLDKVKFLSDGSTPSLELGDNWKMEIVFYQNNDNNDWFNKICQKYEIDENLGSIIEKKNEELKRENDEKMLFDSIENEWLTISDVIQLVNDQKSTESTIQDLSWKIDSSKITLEETQLREDWLKQKIVEKDKTIEEKDNIISKIKEILDWLSSVFWKTILNDDSKKEIEWLIK